MRREANERSLDSRPQNLPFLGSLELYCEILLEVGVPLSIVSLFAHECLDFSNLIHRLNLVPTGVVPAKVESHLEIEVLHVDISEIKRSSKIKRGSSLLERGMSYRRVLS